MWRDRTNLYISYRQSYSHHPAKRPRFISSSEDRQGLLSDQGNGSDDAIIEMSSLPPAWTDVQDEVNTILGTIAAKSSALDRLHQKHVLPGFDDNRAKEEGEIERLTSEITTLFHKCQNAIRKMETMGNSGGGEGVMRRNAQMALAARVQEISTNFRKKQSAYLKKLRGLNGITTPLDRAASPAGGYSSMMQDDDLDVSYSRSALQQSATLTSNDAAISQREREITDIAQGIIELAEIFKELQTMVIDQGTMLDRIDYNVERMNVNVKEADKELKIAVNYQARTIKRKIMLLLIIMIVGVIILLTLKPSHRAPPPPPPPPPAAPPIEDKPPIEKPVHPPAEAAAQPPSHADPAVIDGSPFERRSVIYELRNLDPGLL